MRWTMAGLLVWAWASSSAWAYWKPAHADLPDFDRRQGTRAAPAPPPAQRLEAVERLRQRVPRVRVKFDATLGTPRSIASPESFLSGPAGTGKGIATVYARRGQPDDPRHPITDFVQEHRELFGHDAAVIAAARLVRDDTAPETGLRSLVWAQDWEGIPVYEGVLVGHVTRDGELVNVASRFLTDVEAAASAGTPRYATVLNAPPVTAPLAVVIAAAAVEEVVLLETVQPWGEPPLSEAHPWRFQAGHLPGQAEARKVWLPLDPGTLRLCWQVELTRHAGNERYRLLVDAQSGEVLLRRCLTVYLTDATYRVYTSDSPSPFSPSHPEPSTNQPPTVPRQWVTLPALHTNASPLGWISEAGNETLGNNVDAHLDRNADNAADLPRPQGSPRRVFAFPLDLEQSPESYGYAAAVQLFYWCNWMHDQLYDLGFTEAAGNFQKDNLGRGGLGGDPVLADAQDGSGVNNANFTPTYDGTPPRIQMFVFDGPTPARDGSLDGEIVIHEYAHGLTDRLIGGGVGISALQTYGMGEGWSDWYALALLSEPDDDVDGTYAVGGYATWQFYGLTENYYYGIRRYPYSTDRRKNPLTFKDIDPFQADPHVGVPINPVFGMGNPSEVHNQGEVWCVTLWEVRANLVRKHGFAAGNRLALQLVTDGLKLSPPNPNFLEARDAIIQADLVRTGGANYNDLWAAFAKRGLGFSAEAPASVTTIGVREAFDLPDALLVNALGGTTFSGPVTGPFVPECKTFGLTNHTTAPLEWRLDSSAAWLTVSAGSGALAGATAGAVAVCLNAEAAQLPLGIHAATLTFSNATSGVAQTRDLRLRVVGFAGLPFSEDFESGVLQPYWSVSGTGPFRTQITPDYEPHESQHQVIMDSYSNGTFARNELTLGLDLSGYTNVVLRFWAKEFGEDPHVPPASPFVDGADFDGVAISPDGVRWYEALSLRNLHQHHAEQVVALDDVLAAHGLGYTATFQIRFNQYDNYAIAVDGIALDDIRVSGVPARRFTLLLPEQENEGGGVLAGQGTVRLGAPVPADLTVQLVSSDPARLGVPATVTIPAGADAVTFDLTLRDNTLRDGTQPVEIGVSALDHVPTTALILVNDNEAAELQLRINGNAREGDPAGQHWGQVRARPRPDTDITITLLSSDPSEVRLPPVVVLPAGQEAVEFALEIVDDLELDGPQHVTVTAHVENWQDGTGPIQVDDNDQQQLRLWLPAVASEGNGELPKAGTVGLAAQQTNDLEVTLVSSHPGELSVPSTVRIPAGAFTVPFDLTVLDDPAIDGPLTVTVTATVPQYESATAQVRVLDDETPLVPYQPNPPDGAREVSVRAHLAWAAGVGETLVNGGFETGDLTGWTAKHSGFGSFEINNGELDPEGPEAPVPPFEGTFAVVLQQVGSGAHELYQDATIPGDAKAARLRWADRVRNYAERFAPLAQEFRVEIRATNNAVLAVLYQTRPGDALQTDWVTRQFDLIQYRGQTIRLAFVEVDSLNYFNVHLDAVSLSLGDAPVPTTYDVYFGTDPELGPAQHLGTADAAFWPLPRLALETTYYWQVLARRGEAQTRGPLWQFATRGPGEVDHLEWGPLTSPLLVDQPFAVTLTARDEVDNVVPNFTGPVTVRALADASTRSAVVVSEIEVGGNPRVELANVSGRRLDLSNWQITLFDGLTWPNPRVQFVVPTNSWSPPGGVFLLNRFGKAPGAYPNFYLGTNVFWANVVLANQTAVLVQDADGRVVDYVGAAGADLAMITNPIALPRTAWLGNPLAVNTNAELTYQRVGQADHDTAADWLVATNTLGFWSGHLQAPFTNAVPLRVVPDTLTNFVAGTWQGALVLPQTHDGLTLLAEDAAGHRALSPLLAVVSTNDLAVALEHTPNLPSVGDDVVYRISVTNTGPDAATGVWIVNWLPAAAEFVSVTAAEGSCLHVGDFIVCNLGTVAAATQTEVVIVARPMTAGEFTNLVQVTRAAPDGYPANNVAETVGAANWPMIFSADAVVSEADDQVVLAEFVVELTAPSRLPISVTVATGDGYGEAGVDYESVVTNLLFAPGTRSQQVTVPVLDDRLSEDVEWFFLRFSAPSNALAPVSEYVGIILDNDMPPAMAIDDTIVMEGPPGAVTNAVFRVTLAEPSAVTVSARFTTRDGLVPHQPPTASPFLTNLTGLSTATAFVDYVPQSGTVTLLPGWTNTTITVPVQGDRLYEAPEAFSVVLSAAVNAYLDDAVGIGAILDDDAGELSRYTVSPIPTPRYAGVPFPLTVTARDGLDRLVTDFDGAPQLHGFPEDHVVTLGGGSEEWTYPMNAYYHDGRLQVIYPATEIAHTGTISVVALELRTPPGQTLSNWTVRMKHTPQSAFERAAWESDGWTTVFTKDLAAPNPGWVTFFLDTPFAYNGTDSLMVDFSFDNVSYTTDGVCVFTATDQMRAVFFETDSAFGEPQAWSAGNAPPPLGTNLAPNLRLLIGAPAGVAPTNAGPFAAGVWTGDITIAGPVDGMRLRVVDELDRLGLSQSFTVESGADTDGDELPDAWERRYFGALDTPGGGRDDDPDGDGLINGAELRQGSHPLLPAGVLRILSVRRQAGDTVIRFSTVPGQRYRLEWTDNFATGQWHPAADEIPGTGADLEIMEPGGAGEERRFYRVAVLPTP